MEISREMFDSYLAEFTPQIGHYGWAFALLRRQFRKHGSCGFPYRAFSALRPFFRKGKPFFIGHTGDGVKFLGDWRDSYAVLSTLIERCDAELVDQIVKSIIRQPGSVYLDVGSNMGLLAASIARRLPPGHMVYAFEPVPETAKRAAATIALNNLKNVRLFAGAIGDVDQEITFFSGGAESASSSAHRATCVVNDKEVEMKQITVPCRRLDTLKASGDISGHIGCIKLDVEGNEYAAIKGALGILAEDRSDVIFEYHADIAPKAGWHMRDVARSLRQVADGYRFSTIEAGGTTYLDVDSEQFGNILCESVAPRV